MKFLIILILISSVICAQDNLESVVNDFINEWHINASVADFENYFNKISENGIFLGTDAKEKWTKSEFISWAKPHFENESAWTLTPIERSIYFSDEKTFAWFDEKLETGMGPARGSGILIRTNESWQIVHYNLSLTIPNEIIPQVKKLVSEQLMKD